MRSDNQLAGLDEVTCLLQREPDGMVAVVPSALAEERQLLQRHRLDVRSHFLVPGACSCCATTGDQNCGTRARGGADGHAAMITMIDCGAIREFADAAAAPLL